MNEFSKIVLPEPHLFPIVEALRWRSERMNHEAEKLRRESTILLARAATLSSVAMDLDMDADKLERAAERARPKPKTKVKP